VTKNGSATLLGTNARAVAGRTGAGILVALAAAALAAWLQISPLGIPDPVPLLLLVVALLSFWRGTAAGIGAALVTTAYAGWAYTALTPGPGWMPGGIEQSAVVGVAALGMAWMVGLLKKQAERATAERVARRWAEEEASRFELLSEACGILTSSLDAADTLERFVQHVVPRHADWVAVDTMTPRGEIDRAASAHADPEKQELMEELGEFPPELLSDAPIARVLRTGRPVIVGEVTTQLLDRIARNDEHRRILEELEPRSAMILPLVARQRMVGALTFVSTSRERRYHDEDLPLAVQLADRTAMAIDNSQLFQEAMEANQAKADFLAVMSHELRTPLSAILGYTDLLEAQLAGPVTEAQRTHLGRIRASAWHLAELVDEVLTFARVEAGRQEVRIDEVDLGDLVRSTVEAAETGVDGRPVSLEVDVPEDPVIVRTDPGKLRQVLTNLLANALKFTERGEVRTELRTNGERMCITVKDSGIGIRSAHLEKVFEPFWQVEQGPTRRVGGTGLGLAVAQRLARMLGGDIEVESRFGKGSAFTVMIPVDPAPEEEAAPR